MLTIRACFDLPFLICIKKRHRHLHPLSTSMSGNSRRAEDDRAKCRYKAGDIVTLLTRIGASSAGGLTAKRVRLSLRSLDGPSTTTLRARLAREFFADSRSRRRLIPLKASKAPSRLVSYRQERPSCRLRRAPACLRQRLPGCGGENCHAGLSNGLSNQRGQQDGASIRGCISLHHQTIALLDDIERQLDRDIASLLRLDREEAACLAERIDVPMMELLEEHRACFARPGLARRRHCRRGRGHDALARPDSLTPGVASPSCPRPRLQCFACNSASPHGAGAPGIGSCVFGTRYSATSALKTCPSRREQSGRKAIGVRLASRSAGVSRGRRRTAGGTPFRARPGS